MLADSSSPASVPPVVLTISSSATLRAVAVGGALVGLLDATDGVAFFGLTAGMNPIQVLQYIASGALGAAAFGGGLPAAGLGALFHFGLSFGFTAAFVAAWNRVSLVREHWAVTGLGWGAMVWTLMNLVVLPLSRVPPTPITPLSAIHGLVGHALFVGLAAAVVARRILPER